MCDIRLEREFPVTQQRLFEMLSTQAQLLQWWGHDGWTMMDENLDLSRLGPWFADMRSEEGHRFKLSGQVTRVSPFDVIGFTWGWHDEADQRGIESHVTFTISATAKGARLVLDHRNLASDESAAQHERGWGGPLSRLERLSSIPSTP